MRHQPTSTHRNPEIRRCGEWPALTARDLYLAARLELAAYFAELAQGQEDVTRKQRIPTDAELLAERERLAQGQEVR